MGVGPGDEVVVPSFTFYASAEAIPPTGATPVFCDIDPSTYCVTADTVRAVLTPRTKAVIAVHLFGNLAPVAEIEALGVPVLEDAAQSAGSRVRVGGDAIAGERASAATRPGSLGTAATFSFFPSKNLGGFGDGGAITTSDPDIAERARMLRFHGSFDKVTYDHVGYNSRLDELQAAILRVQLPLLDTWAAGRRAAGSHYEQSGIGELVTLPVAVAGCEPAWHLYVIAHPHPEPLRSRPRRRRHRPQALLPHPHPPPARDAPVGRRRRAARHRTRRRHPPGDPDERGAHAGAGRGGRRRRAPSFGAVAVAVSTSAAGTASGAGSAACVSLAPCCGCAWPSSAACSAASRRMSCVWVCSSSSRSSSRGPLSGGAQSGGAAARDTATSSGCSVSIFTSNCSRVAIWMRRQPPVLRRALGRRRLVLGLDVQRRRDLAGIDSRPAGLLCGARGNRAGGRALARGGSHVGAAALLAFDHALVLQALVHGAHRVGVDLQRLRQIPQTRQALPGRQAPVIDAGAQRPRQLHADRHLRTAVDREIQTPTPGVRFVASHPPTVAGSAPLLPVC